MSRFPDHRPWVICAMAQITQDYRLMGFREHNTNFSKLRGQQVVDNLG
jgi:hypothetical protein